MFVFNCKRQTVVLLLALYYVSNFMISHIMLVRYHQ